MKKLLIVLLTACLAISLAVAGSIVAENRAAVDIDSIIAFAGVGVFLTPYTDEYPYTENGTGETYDNFLLMRMDYITFE